jgi:hypothetical protein
MLKAIPLLLVDLNNTTKMRQKSIGLFLILCFKNSDLLSKLKLNAIQQQVLTACG